MSTAASSPIRKVALTLLLPIVLVGMPTEHSPQAQEVTAPQHQPTAVGQNATTPAPSSRSTLADGAVSSTTVTVKNDGAVATGVIKLDPPADFPPKQASKTSETEPETQTQTPQISTAPATQDPTKQQTSETSPKKNATEMLPIQPVPERIPEPPSNLRIATWGGAHGEAQRRTVFDPFANNTGISIETIEHIGGSKLLKATAANSPVGWDLAYIPYHVADAACRSGAIAKIDAANIKDKTGARLDPADFLPEAFGDCALGGSVWSAVIGYDKRQFQSNAPQQLEDFFDTTKFPGKRGLMRTPRYILEMALLADGVAPEQVYRVLESDGGLQRALGKLATIRNDIVWMKSVREPVAALNDHSVAMAVGFSGRFFLETVGRNSPVVLMWDGQVYDLDVWVIPKGTTHIQTALKFLSFAVQSDVMVHQASLLPYGPTRKSAARQVRRHASLNVDLSDYVPTAPQNFRRALRIDEIWWEKHAARLIPAFRNWIDGPDGIQGE